MTATVTLTTAPERRRIDRRSTVRTFLRRRSVQFSLGWLALIVIASVLAGILAPFDPRAQDLHQVGLGPSFEHLLGTDQFGRDILSRLLHGGGELLLVALIPIVVALLIGVTAGLLAGYRGGFTDSALGFFVNILFAIPSLVVVLAVAVATSSNLLWITLVLGILLSGPLQRLVRSSTASSRNLLYVEAAKVADVRQSQILVRHVLPNVLPPLIVETVLLYSGSFLFLTTLAFLGIGYSPETPSWGQMVSDASANIGTYPWMMVPIGAVIILTVLALNAIGAGLIASLPRSERANLLGQYTRKRSAPASEVRPTNNDAVLIVNDLVVAVEVGGKDIVVVDHVSFSLGRGEVLGLVGESGCGKTMTALTLLGLTPPPGHVTSGEIWLGNQSLVGLAEREWERIRGARIAYIPQEPMAALDPCFTVAFQLHEALRSGRTSLASSAIRARSTELLRLVEIADTDRVLKLYPHQLSGGMAQRVAIAIALAGEPEVLVADEPTTALDVTLQAEILELLRSVQERLGTAIIFVTHDLGVVADICDRILVMYAGEVIESGDTGSVLSAPQHPYTAALLKAVPDALPAGERLHALEGSVPIPAAWPSHCRFANRCEFASAKCREAPVPLQFVKEAAEVRCVRWPEVINRVARERSEGVA